MAYGEGSDGVTVERYEDRWMKLLLGLAASKGLDVAVCGRHPQLLLK